MDEEDYSALPLMDRAVHKVWKVRLAAYEEMKKQFTMSGSESDSCFRPFVDNPGIYKKIVMDSNVVAQEAGIASLATFLEFGGSNASLRIRPTVVGPLVEKGLSSTRAATRQNSVDCILWFIELDTPDPVMDELAPYLSHKLPKLVAATTLALAEVFKAFGAKTVSPKPILKSIPKLFAHADKTVRAGATTLVVELYRWLGPAISTIILPDLKPVQQKELEELFEKAKLDPPHQLRYLKSQRDAMERQQASGISSGAAPAEGAADDAMDEDDALDFVEAVNVLPKIAPNLGEMLGSTKWKDRKEALEALYPVVNVPKIAPEDFTDLVRLLAKCMKDANIQVVILAANCIQALAIGLRAQFSRYEQSVLAPILERTKEKKTTVSDALGAALDSIFKYSSFSATYETTLEFLKHKTPQVKIEASKFLVRCLKTTPTIPSPPEIKQVIEASIKLLSDTQEPVRTGAAEILGVTMKIIGERAMNPHMDVIDDLKKGKIREFYESAEVKAKPAKARPTAVAAPPASAASYSSKPGARPVQAMRSTPAKPPPSARRRLVSPTKTRQTPSAVRQTPQTLQSVQPPSFALSKEETTPAPSRPGLTGRALPSRQPVARPQAAVSDTRLAELVQLREERVEWQKEREQLVWKAQEDHAEKTRLLQELSDSQQKIAELIESRTNDTLQAKSSATQLTRALSDVETLRSRNAKLEAELARLRSSMRSASDGSDGGAAGLGIDPPPVAPGGSVLRTLSAGRSTTAGSRPLGGSSSPKSPSMTLQFGLDTRNSLMSSVVPGGRTHSGNPMRRSVDLSNLSLAEDDQQGLPSGLGRASDKENGLSERPVKARPVSMIGASSLPSSIDASESAKDASSTGSGPENWRRAAAVTSELRARIEAMRRARAVV